MKNYFIHIGMPRTGTTFLQRKVFPNIDGYSYYGIPYTNYNQAFQKMMFMDDSLFDKDEFINEINKLEGDNIILSNENFIGQSLFYHHSNRTKIAQRLHQAMPNATIILYLRNQVDLLKSLYLISVGWKEHKTIDDFVWKKRTNYTVENYQKGRLDYGENEAYYSTFNSYEHLDGYIYNALITLYKNLFPKVEIILYEDFIAHPEKVQQRLEGIFNTAFNSTVTTSFTNKEVLNQGYNKNQANWLRRLNKWHNVAEDSNFKSRVLTKLKRLVINHIKSDKKLDFSDETLKFLKDFYKPYNQQLAKDFPELGLNEFAKDYLL
ncbi:MAG: hypothetical protein HYU68_07075 [Bacteroidetes bacterium]|nr:hypothetical protein [Bacteroidota bacterium]